MGHALRLSRFVLQCSEHTVDSSVLICHGLLGSKQNWKSISRVLSQKMCGTIVAVDLRNHGESPHSNYMSYADMCRDITLVVDDLKLRNVCLVGHSMGGKAVMYAALTEPDKYDKLVVLDISPAPKPAAQSVLSLIDLMSSVDLEEMGRKCGNNAAVVRNTLMTDWKEPVPDSIVRGFLLTNLDERNGKLLWRVNLDAVRKFWQQISNFPNEKVNGHVFDRPALFIASSKGGYLDASDVPAIRNYFPQARILQIANTGHWVHFDAPNALISLITSFIQEESVNIKSFIDVTELQ